MSDWCAREFAGVKMGDVRLEKRLVKIGRALSANPESNLPEAMGDWAGAKAAYRFFDNARVDAGEIRRAHAERTAARAQEAGRVLAIQDTTNLDYSSHRQMEGLGPIGHVEGQVHYDRGLRLHTTLLSTLYGEAVGVADQQLWARDLASAGRSKHRRKRSVEEKESRKWAQGLSGVEALLPADVQVIHMGDREADLYPLFAAPRRTGSELLVRAAYDRRVEEEDPAVRLLSEALERVSVGGWTQVEVRRPQGTPLRTASLSVRWLTVTIKPPAYYKGEYVPVRLQAILVREEEPPQGAEPLRWLLLTSLPVETLADALECVRLYALRWLIEHYHFVLKSGCRIEKLQLANTQRLERALALYAAVAWRLLALQRQARLMPYDPASGILEPGEWRALSCWVHRTTKPPLEPPNVQQAALWIARLGGFLGRKGDGEPGLRTLWRGLMRLDDITRAYALFAATLTCG